MVGTRGAAVVGLVEDDAALRRALARLLRSHGLRVEAYGSPEQLLRRATHGRCPYAVLLLDVHLGPNSGVDLYKRLTAAGLAIPAIFMTGRDDVPTRQRVARVGGGAYLVKPFADAALLDAIRLMLAGARPAARSNRSLGA